MTIQRRWVWICDYPDCLNFELEPSKRYGGRPFRWTVRNVGWPWWRKLFSAAPGVRCPEHSDA